MGAQGSRRGHSAIRRCQGCGSALAADNTAQTCGRCLRDQRDRLRTPPHLDDSFFETPELRAAFDSHHIGRVFKAYRHHPQHLKLYGKALNQEILGQWLGINQAQVSRLENGPREVNITTLTHYAQVLHLPQHMLWWDFPGQSRRTSPQRTIDNLLVAAPANFIGTGLNALDTVDSYLLAEEFLYEDREPVPLSALAGTIREMTSDLMTMDFKHGGGHVRRLLRNYFRDEVAPLLSWNYPDSTLQCEVFGAAAETLQLLGWSAYDAGLQEEAKRYFIKALQLSKQSGDIVMQGRLLSNLSHQANFLEQFDTALKLARDAQNVASGTASNTVMAMLVSMEARALASKGDAPGFAKAMHRAEQLHESRNIENDPAWSSYFNEQEIASEAAHGFRDLGNAEKAREFASIALDPEYTPPRTLGFMRLVAASGVLAGGDAEQAASLASEAISLGVSLQSARYVKYITDFYGALTAADAKLGAQISEALHLHYPAMKLLG